MLQVTRFGKQFGCGHTPKFLQGAGPAKMLVGELPKPAVLRDKLSQSTGALHRSLWPATIVPGPYFHARLLCRADDQCLLLLQRPPAFAAGLPGILHKALSFVPPAHGGIFLVFQSYLICIAYTVDTVLSISHCFTA